MPQRPVYLTTKDVLQRIQEAVEKGDHEVDLQGFIFKDFELHDMEIPVSLNCKGSTFNEPINLCRSKFLGNYIDLEDAEIRKGIFLTALEPTAERYSLYLRRAKLWGKIELQNTRLNWLVTDGMQCYPDEDGKMGIIHLHNTDVEMGLSFQERE